MKIALCLAFLAATAAGRSFSIANDNFMLDDEPYQVRTDLDPAARAKAHFAMWKDSGCLCALLSHPPQRMERPPPAPASHGPEQHSNLYVSSNPSGFTAWRWNSNRVGLPMQTCPGTSTTRSRACTTLKVAVILLR